MAAKQGEARVDDALRCLLEEGEIGEGKLNAEAVSGSAERGSSLLPATQIAVADVSLASFDELLGGADRRCAMNAPRDVKKTDRVSAGTPSAGDPALLRGKSAPGRTGDAELRAVSAGVGRTGMPGAAREPDRAFAAGLQAAAGEDHGELRPEAAAGESGAPGQGAAGRHVPGPPRERARLRQSRQRQDASAVRSRAGTDSQRPQSASATCARWCRICCGPRRNCGLSRAIQKLAYYEALVIDDLGYVQQSREEMEVLFTLLAERYERGSVLITSNLPFSKWEAIFKDPMTTAAAIDRLVHHSVILELNIPSYRMEQAKKNNKPEDE